jgi:hypothetical protein
MFWIGTALMLVAGVAALMVIILAKRPIRAGQLGSVSDRWIAEHHVD